MTMLKNRKVLVLNKGWSAIGVVTLERALVMLFSTYSTGEPKARIIDPTKDFQTFTWEDWSSLKPENGEDAINGARDKFRVPEVILLSKYEKIPQHKVQFSRRTIYKRDNNQCQYCGATPPTSMLTIDHIKPRCRGGKTTWENCVLCCQPCNCRKADKMLEECGMKLRKKPQKPNFLPFRGEVRLKSWSHFISEMYWNVELENDN